MTNKIDIFCWELKKTRNSVRNMCKNMPLALFRSRINTSEDLPFGGGLNSWLASEVTAAMLVELSQKNLIKKPQPEDNLKK